MSKKTRAKFPIPIILVSEALEKFDGIGKHNIISVLHIILILKKNLIAVVDKIQR